MKRPVASSQTSAQNRRTFFKNSGARIGMAAFAALAQAVPSSGSETWPVPKHSLIRKNEVVLFQGDSITDAGRSRDKANTANEQPGLGHGYAWFAAGELLVDRPNDGLKIYNRGISGNKVFQLAERWQAECLELKPDILSILIGVNDFWHTLDGKYQGTVEVYERDYNALLERTRQALPKVTLVVCEPFVLRCGAVNDKWFPQFEGYRAAAKRVASAHKATFVPFQAVFDEAIKYAPPREWAEDGVHPSATGAALMAHAWLRTVAGA
jgi:lysophospholipase L1-like esterase